MCYATFVIRNLLFVSFQIISRIMRCFQFIKLGTASLTNNIHDIVRIISVCGYIFRKLIVHVAKFTYSEDCYSHKAIVSPVDPLRIYFSISSSDVCCFKQALFTVRKYSIAFRKPEMDFSHSVSYRNLK